MPPAHGYMAASCSSAGCTAGEMCIGQQPALTATSKILSQRAVAQPRSKILDLPLQQTPAHNRSGQRPPRVPCWFLGQSAMQALLDETIESLSARRWEREQDATQHNVRRWLDAGFACQAIDVRLCVFWLQAPKKLCTFITIIEVHKSVKVHGNNEQQE